MGWRDEGTKGRRDEGTKGRRDEGSKGRRDEGTEGRRDEGFQYGGVSVEMSVWRCQCGGGFSAEEVSVEKVCVKRRCYVTV